MASPSSTPTFRPQHVADAALKTPRFRAPHLWAYRGVSKESKESKNSSLLSSSPDSSLSSAKSSPHYLTSTKPSINGSTGTPVSKIPIRTPLNSDLKPRSASHVQVKRPKVVSKVSECISPDSSQKPLPSPPIVQVTNPTSPVKSVRGIIDAKEKPLRQSSGTPNEQDWPTLSPDRPHTAEGSKAEGRGERVGNGSPEPRQKFNTARGKEDMNDESNDSLAMVQASERNDTFERVHPDFEISDSTQSGNGTVSKLSSAAPALEKGHAPNVREKKSISLRSSSNSSLRDRIFDNGSITNGPAQVTKSSRPKLVTIKSSAAEDFLDHAAPPVVQSGTGSLSAQRVPPKPRSSLPRRVMPTVNAESSGRKPSESRRDSRTPVVERTNKYEVQLRIFEGTNELILGPSSADEQPSLRSKASASESLRRAAKALDPRKISHETAKLTTASSCTLVEAPEPGLHATGSNARHGMEDDPSRTQHFNTALSLLEGNKEAESADDKPPSTPDTGTWFGQAQKAEKDLHCHPPRSSSLARGLDDLVSRSSTVKTSHSAKDCPQLRLRSSLRSFEDLPSVRNSSASPLPRQTSNRTLHSTRSGSAVENSPLYTRGSGRTRDNRVFSRASSIRPPVPPKNPPIPPKDARRSLPKESSQASLGIWPPPEPKRIIVSGEPSTIGEPYHHVTNLDTNAASSNVRAAPANITVKRSSSKKNRAIDGLRGLFRKSEAKKRTASPVTKPVRRTAKLSTTTSAGSPARPAPSFRRQSTLHQPTKASAARKQTSTTLNTRVPKTTTSDISPVSRTDSMIPDPPSMEQSKKIAERLIEQAHKSDDENEKMKLFLSAQAVLGALESAKSAAISLERSQQALNRARLSYEVTNLGMKHLVNVFTESNSIQNLIKAADEMKATLNEG